MISRIAHPTDLSPDGSAAFCHALRLAIEFRCRLDILHVRSPKDLDNWADFPHVREILARWGLLNAAASIDDNESDLGITVHKIEIEHHDAVGGISNFLRAHPTELIVLATHEASGLAQWLAGSVSKSIARQTHIPTLFVRPEVRSFVDQQSGALGLNRLVVPLARNPSPRRTLHKLNALLHPLKPVIQTFHVGDVAPWILDDDGNPIDVKLMQGPVVEAILEAAEHADLIAMPTEGRHGFLDALRGSTTEQVLRRASCALLAIPA